MTTVIQPPLILNPSGRLRAGCYLICYTPSDPDPDVLHYDGTLRVQWVDKDGNDPRDKGGYNGGALDKDKYPFILASGDLYAHFKDRPVEAPKVGTTGAIDIPIFPREEYRFYLCVKSVPSWSITAGGFDLVIESHSYDRYHDPDRRWYSEGLFTAAMRWDLPPLGCPRDALYAAGPVLEPSGKFNGTLTMTWISEYFRRAKLVVHQARGVDHVPHDWVKQFKKFDWELETDVIENEGQITQNGQPQGAPWTDAQLQEVLEEVRKSQRPDQLWRYDLLFVPKLFGEERGVTLYHTEDLKGGYVRELATVAAQYTFPTKNQVDGNLYNYGDVAGELQSQKKLYLRTAMHELGHAMGLGHSSAESRRGEFGFMMTTDSLAHVTNQPPENRSVKPFPENAGDGFSQGDLQRLRHWPDFVVRPGTDADAKVLPAVTVPVFPDPGQDEKPPPERQLARDVCLHAAPLMDEVPIGAPVRIVYRLICLKGSAQVPRNLGFKSGALTVWVTDAHDRSVRMVSPSENRDEGPPLVQLVAPGQWPFAATLLRGDDGNPLFPKAGEYKVNLEVAWWNPVGKPVGGYKDPAGEKNGKGVEYIVKAETKVTITPDVPEDPNTPPDLGSPPTHAEAARSVLTTPELQEVLVRHTALIPAANTALELAMKCPILEPHFAYLDFRVRVDTLSSQGKDLEPAFQVLLNASKPQAEPPQPYLTPVERDKALDRLGPPQKQAIRGPDWKNKARAMLKALIPKEYAPESLPSANDLKPSAGSTTTAIAQTSAMKARPGRSPIGTAAAAKRKPGKTGPGSTPYVKKLKPPTL